MDRAFIARRSRGLFRFLSDSYWRIETRGLEHVPRQGPAILVGTHRGFVPWDAMMALHLILRATGRIPRFLVHPGLLKFSPIARIITQLGGVLALRANAERVLSAGEILGVFPEGVQGAFTPVRRAYQLHKFGHDAFVRLALRHRAPIIPLVTVGSAEVFPIFATIHSRRWKHYAKWPCIPITTFPLALPVKWHMQWLPPVTAEELLPPGELNASSVKAAASQLRLIMQQATDAMLQRRHSHFVGSVFDRV